MDSPSLPRSGSLMSPPTLSSSSHPPLKRTDSDMNSLRISHSSSLRRTASEMHFQSLQANLQDISQSTPKQSKPKQGWGPRCCPGKKVCVTDSINTFISLSCCIFGGGWNNLTAFVAGTASIAPLITRRATMLLGWDEAVNLAQQAWELGQTIDELRDQNSNLEETAKKFGELANKLNTNLKKTILERDELNRVNKELEASSSALQENCASLKRELRSFQRTQKQLGFTVSQMDEKLRQSQDLSARFAAYEAQALANAMDQSGSTTNALEDTVEGNSLREDLSSSVSSIRGVKKQSDATKAELIESLGELVASVAAVEENHNSAVTQIQALKRRMSRLSSVDSELTDEVKTLRGLLEESTNELEILRAQLKSLQPLIEMITKLGGIENTILLIQEAEKARNLAANKVMTV